MDVFTAIADPIRRELLIHLADGPRRVVDLAAAHSVSRPAISRHLRVLGEAGLVRGADHGRERHYTLDTTPLSQVHELLNTLGSGRRPVSGHHLDALATEVRRTGRDRRQHPDTLASRPATPKEDIA